MGSGAFARQTSPISQWLVTCGDGLVWIGFDEQREKPIDRPI
jgi:hypothetical protein